MVATADICGVPPWASVSAICQRDGAETMGMRDRRFGGFLSQNPFENSAFLSESRKFQRRLFNYRCKSLFMLKNCASAHSCIKEESFRLFR